MKLEDILLRKEELPISYETLFKVPIHFLLLKKDIKIDDRIAHDVFPDAAQEWYSDLKEYSKMLDDKEKKE